MSHQTPHYNVRQSASYAKTLGITQRSTHLAFPWVGELRVRFSDFQVNEIGKDGSVLHLRQIGLGGDRQMTQELPAQDPEASQDVQHPRNEKKVDASEQSRETESQEIPAEDMAALEALTSPKFAQELVALFKTINGDDLDKRKSVTSEPINRYNRGQVHEAVRRIFKSRIETSTDSDSAIVATLAAPLRKGDKRSRGARDQRRGAAKPVGAEYLHFTLFKDNRGTMDAVSQIARFLRVKPQVITYAGTKDRRASTVQRCSVRYIRDTNLAGLNGKLRGITTGDYEYKEEPMHLGELLGNEFTITIKNCEMMAGTDAGASAAAETMSEKLDAIRSNVQSALDKMVEHGWINYFGHQRFGTHEIGTHQIGKLILANRFEDAVNCILAYDEETAQKAETEIPSEPSKRDDYARHQACMLFRTGKDVQGAIDLMPKRFTAEGCVMRHLNRQGAPSRRDFVGAVIHITRGLRSMYLHAYQSHVWNHAASKRWELFGAKVVAGDLVIAETEAAPQINGQDEDGDDIVNPVDDEHEAPVRARPLSEEEASNGQFTIHDVVLPTPGYDVIYPENEIGQFYMEFMGTEENGSLDPHKMRRLRREFSLPGRYRKIMHKFLAESSVEFRAYADDEEQMHPTDLDLLTKTSSANMPPRGGKRGHNETEMDDHVRGEEALRPSKIVKVDDQVNVLTPAEPQGQVMEQEKEKGKEGHEQRLPVTDSPKQIGRLGEPTKIAAIVKFQLGRSAYATVTLRELMGDPPEDKQATILPSRDLK